MTTLSPLAPYSQELEERLLGLCISDTRCVIDAAAYVSADDFYILRHGYIFEAITRLHEQSTLIDVNTVVDELDRMGRLDDIGGMPYLVHLIGGFSSAERVDSYAKRVAEYAYRRRLLIAGDEIKALALDGQIPYEQLRAEVDGRTESADNGRLRSSDVVSLHEEVNAYFDWIEATANLGTGITGEATGFSAYDQILDGGQARSLNLLAARPGMGKTSALLCMALDMAKRGKHVYYWSGEMDRKQIRERLMSILAGIPAYKLRLGLRPGGLSSEQWALFVEKASDLAKLPIWIDDREDMTPSLLYATCKRIARRNGDLDDIFVDHIGLLEPGVKKENRDKELGYISRKLKTKLAKIAPVWCAAQLSRKVEDRADKRPVMSDLRDSGNLEQDADTVTFIYRDAVYNEATEFPNRADFIVAKNRHGKVGTAYLHFEKSLTKFSDGRTQTMDLSQL